MALTGNGTFKDTIKEYDASTPVIYTVYNEVHQDLINNDVYLKNRVDGVDDEIAEARDGNTSLADRFAGIVNRLAALEDSEIIESGIKLEGLSSALHQMEQYLAQGKIEIAYPDFTLADTLQVEVINGVAGDDSLDLVDTSALKTGVIYHLTDGTNQEQVIISQILSGQRVKLTSLLQHNYGNDASLKRTTAIVDYENHRIDGAGVYYTRPLRVSGKGKLIVLSTGTEAPMAEVSYAATESYTALGQESSRNVDGALETVFAFDAGTNQEATFRLTLGEYSVSAIILQERQQSETVESGMVSVVSLTSTFAGESGQTITHNIGHQNYVVNVEVTENPGGDLGEVWITKNANTVTVHNSGGARTGFKITVSIPVKDVLTGNANFNSAAGTTITHDVGHTNYDVGIVPTQNPNGYLGEVFISKAANSFVVYNSGTAKTAFQWTLMK
ncbi:hypothetical protein KDJ56_11200 [Brevibacillus composti]|uniref:Uncharacterized protein n=1 Tax=Brevibacillus composti TaxID=2796470 RepID=A0ABX7ZA40_9BACL|nr:hypothetical protein [Brevibacillus composti]QUO43467.1 hypothetical protein KDJ56_11200 [Brevibacillus composti]